jgi:hypothetical protein
MAIHVDLTELHAVQREDGTKQVCNPELAIIAQVTSFYSRAQLLQTPNNMV